MDPFEAGTSEAPLPDDVEAADAVRFRDDVRRAAEVCRVTPALPAMTTLLAVCVAWAGSSAPGHTVVSLIALVFLGWVGSERLWFLRAYTGRPLSMRAALRASFNYWPRLVKLTLLLGVVTVPLSVPIFIATAHATSGGHGRPVHVDLPLWALLYSTVFSLVIDFALTFVTPALIFTTKGASEALRIGLRLLRQTWPHAAPYVLVPPLAVVILSRLAGGDVGWVGATVIVLSYLVNLLAKGATASYYLRLVQPATPNGDLDIYLP